MLAALSVIACIGYSLQSDRGKPKDLSPENWDIGRDLSSKGYRTMDGSPIISEDSAQKPRWFDDGDEHEHQAKDVDCACCSKDPGRKTEHIIAAALGASIAIALVVWILYLQKDM